MHEGFFAQTFFKKYSSLSESLLQDDEKPLLIVDQARLQGKSYCAFAYQRKDAQNAWPSQMGIDLSSKP